MKPSTILVFFLCFSTSLTHAQAHQKSKSNSGNLHTPPNTKMHTRGKQPIRFAPNRRDGQNSDWSCPPVSDADGTGKCGLDLGMQETICDGEGGASSTGRDGGHTCSFPD
ncbi:MAG: hypothetical protein ACRBBR_03015 [Cellvibrionaceae bacterium]